MVEETYSDNAAGGSGGIGNNNVVDGDDSFGDDGGSDEDITALASRDLIVQSRQQTSANCHNTL